MLSDLVGFILQAYRSMVRRIDWFIEERLDFEHVWLPCMVTTILMPLFNLWAGIALFAALVLIGVLWATDPSSGNLALNRKQSN